MEEVLTRHRKEQRDLQAQITQKKKSASKKTRKGVNDECARLEEELKARHERELAALDSNSVNGDPSHPQNETAPSDDANDSDDDLLAAIASSTPTTSLTTATASLTLDPSSSSNSTSIPTASNSAPRKPNRQKARLARRAAEQEEAALLAASEAQNLPDLKQRERTRMLEEFEKRGLKEREVAANGHCLYSAMADQMRQMGRGRALRGTDAGGGGGSGGPDGADGEGEDAAEGKELRNDDYKTVRQAAATYISQNPDDFVPFLEEPLEEYVRKIRDTGEWGGQLELMALARTYGIDIQVLQGDGRVEKIEGSGEKGKEKGQEKPTAWLAYYRHGFGLGEHYNSLRKS